MRSSAQFNESAASHTAKQSHMVVANTKAYNKGSSALYERLEECVALIAYQEGIDVAKVLRKLYALAEFSVNKYCPEFYDVKVKSVYYVRDGGECYIRMGDFKSFTVYKCLKLKKPREYAAIAYSGDHISIDEAVSSKVVQATRTGRYGDFTTLYLPEDYTDFEEI